MPAAHPEEFRRRAAELARRREKPIAQIARDLGTSESCLRRWMELADVEEGHEGGPDSRRACRVGAVAPGEAGPGDGSGDPQTGQRLLRPGEHLPK